MSIIDRLCDALQGATEVIHNVHHRGEIDGAPVSYVDCPYGRCRANAELICDAVMEEAASAPATRVEVEH